MESIDRFFTPPRESFYLLGPRGTGKSSWARAAYPDALWVELLDPATFRTYSAYPERLRALVEGNPGKNIIIVDEIQKAPELLSVVHALREEKKSVQFVLTGSSARKLKRGAHNLLGGRALMRTLHPFMAAELGNQFDLNRALRFGLVPLIVASKEPEETLKAYHTLYIREEVQWGGLVRNIGSFARFLEAISFSHGSILNISNIARECETERKTVEGFVELLEDLLLAYRIPIFTKRARRAHTVHPKFYLFDSGVFRSVRPSGPLDRAEDMEGAALEGLVLQHLRAWNSYRGDNNNVYYWRTRSGVEVDFVIYGDDGFWAVEVKNSRRVHSADIDSLRTFNEDYPEATPILLYRGKERLKIDGIICVPCEEFLLQIRPSRKKIYE
ncbi:MAG: ATP-binding protein [Planctomycetes bacterium]|nr:ATP-binding protein [Planctomycetota bacterium]